MSLLDQIYANVGGAGGKYAGVTYDLVPGNSVLEVLQTPDLWGVQPDSTGYYTGLNRPGQNLTAAIQNVVQSAISVVDIATLAPFPDGAFLDAIRTGLLNRTHASTPLLVRVHAGLHPLLKEAVNGKAAVEHFIDALTDGLPANAPITIAVSMAMMSAVQKSWNHGKVVVADGQQVVFGGHNQWAGDYLGFAPVHDLSLLVAGPAAASAHTFCDLIWGYVGNWYTSLNPATRVWSMVWRNGQVTSAPSPARPAVNPTAVGTARAMPVMRMGAGVVNASDDSTDQVSNLAKKEAFKAAQRSIKISQQDLAFSLRGAVSEYATFADWLDNDVVSALGGALDRGVDVDVVVSGRHAKAATGNPYANMGGAATKQALMDWFRNVDGMTRARLDTLMSHLHIAELHTVATNFNPWKQGLDECVQANHAKVYIIDDAVAYVGSDNLYPCSLLEFGMLIEDAAAVQSLLGSYWNNLWANAHPVA